MSDYSDYDDDNTYEYDSDDYDEPALDEDNDSDYDIPVAKQDKGKQKVATIDARGLSLDALQDMINDNVRRVASVTGLQSSIAAILLQHYRWNEDRLLDHYMEKPQDVLRDLGEPQNVLSEVDDDGSPPPHKRARIDAQELLECPVCCDTTLAQGSFKMRCGHRFCKECWKDYVAAKVKDEGQSYFKCMQDGCATVMDEVSIQRLGVPDSIHQRYKELIRRSFVQVNGDLQFCPYPGCSQTVFCTGGRGDSLLTEVPTVHCSMDHAFCFGCGSEDHRPCICKWIPIWNKNARDDAGTSQWLKANTRECPKCKNNIEKNGGCNRILCRHCQNQFCWMCMQDWDIHGYNSSVCNAFKEPEPDEASNEAKQNLERWLFYFDRFNNHELSAKLDRELCEKTEERMVEVQETSQLSWIQAKFMQEAVDELTKCRQTLKWSYAMAYFMAKGNEKAIFEDLQADLEKAVEQLSQMIQEPVETETVKDLRQRMIDKTVYVRTRHEILLADTAEGLRDGRWEWTQ